MSRLNTVKSEIHNVLSTVRLTERSMVSRNSNNNDDVFLLLRDNQDSIYVQRLQMLHEYLLTFDNLEEVECSTFLDPFLLVIREHSNALVVGVALASLNKLLLYGAISPSSALNVKQGINLAVESVCQMHRAKDEVVHLQALEVLVSLLRAGEEVTDLNVWSIVIECFEIATATKHSDLLKAYAANQLSHVTLYIFSHDHRGSLQVKLLKFLTKLTRNAKHASMGLQLINICLETATTAENSSSNDAMLAPIIQNELFDSLLENSQTQNLAVFALLLRVVYNLFSSPRSLNLKVQLEIFLSSVHFHYLETSASNNERRELALESLLDFCHDRVLVLNLFANFDCDVKSSNLFERLCKLLFKFAIGNADGELNKLNVLALDGLFSIVSRLESRCGLSTLPNDLLDEEEAWIRKHAHKRRLVQCATAFNKYSPMWQDMAKELGYEQIDSFVFAASNLLDKQVLGDYLADNGEVLSSYLANHFDLTNMRVDEALRLFLSTFRIPGEAQKIDRVIEAFAKQYFATSNQDGVFANFDAVYIFSFSIIMLHTDRHSRSINAADRMTFEQFVRNVRGINNGSDFPTEFLREVFDAVSEREFILTSKPGSGNGDASSASSSPSTLPGSEFVHHVNLEVAGGPQERKMFEIVFDSMLQVVDSALPRSTSSKLTFRLLCCSAHLATIAQYFGMCEQFNLVVITLCKHFFSLLPHTVAMVDAGEMQLDEDDETFVVAKNIIKIVLRNENCVREAWANVLLLLAMLMQHGFLPGGEEAAVAEEEQVDDEEPAPASSLWFSVTSFFGGADEREEQRLEQKRRALQLAYKSTVCKYFEFELHELLMQMQQLKDEHSRAHLANAIWSPFCAAEKPFAWESRRAILLPNLLVILTSLQGADFLFPSIADECFEAALTTNGNSDLVPALFFSLDSQMIGNMPKSWQAMIKLVKEHPEACVHAELVSHLQNKQWMELVQQMEPSFVGLSMLEAREICEEDELVQYLEVLNRYLEIPSMRGKALRCFKRFETPCLSEQDSTWLLILGTVKCYWDCDEPEVAEILSSLLVASVSSTSTARGELILDKILFPLVVQQTQQKRRVDAQLVLGRYFLVLYSRARGEEESGFVERQLAVTMDYLLIGLDSIKHEDRKESLVQMILNLVNVVIAVGGEAEASRLAMVSAKLDSALPATWREVLSNDYLK